MKLLHRIFHGDFRPADGIRYSESYNRRMHENFQAHQTFRDSLQEEQREAFDGLMEMDIELSGQAQEDNYIAGMKSGIQLMQEVFS